jgi:hypothetical protein
MKMSFLMLISTTCSSLMEKPKSLTPKQAAEIMGVTPQFIRCGLQQGRFPFGTAVKMSKQWSYYINAHQFYQYLGVKDTEETA